MVGSFFTMDVRATGAKPSSRTSFGSTRPLFCTNSGRCKAFAPYQLRGSTKHSLRKSCTWSF